MERTPTDRTSATLAGQWFDRCWFGMFPEMTFLSWLIEWGGIDEVLQAWEDIADSTDNIKITQEELSSGIIKSGRGETYTWQDLVHGDGIPSYSSREEWEEEQRGYIEQEQDIIDSCRGNCFRIFGTSIRNKKRSTSQERLMKN